MKVHIISLQRTGSKALESAIYKALDNPLSIEGGDPLGEFLHCWSYYGYKFGPSAKKPFDPAAEIVFKTHPKYEDYQGVAFDVLPCFEDGHSNLEWELVDHTDVLTSVDVSYRLGLIKKTDRNLVVKTQLASLYEDIGEDRISLSYLDSIFDLTIFLSPSNPVQWLCSNFMCDASGVFVSCAQQSSFADYAKLNPLTIPEEYIRKLRTRYLRHQDMSLSYSECMYFQTDDLKNPKLIEDCFKDVLPDVKIEYVPEFSAFDYSTMIANYDEVREAF